MRNVAALTAVGLLIGTAAYAANVHLVPPNEDPSFIDLGTMLNVAGRLAGLGNEDIQIVLNATANVEAVCINPSGKNQPPGQNPAPITVTGTEFIPAENIENGNVSFSLDTGLVSEIADAPDCPNGRWTEKVVDLEFLTATIAVYQPAEDFPNSLVLTVSCTFDPPTQDGPVPDAGVTCTATSV
jgi:hypothetical protein